MSSGLQRGTSASALDKLCTDPHETHIYNDCLNSPAPFFLLTACCNFALQSPQNYSIDRREGRVASQDSTQFHRHIRLTRSLGHDSREQTFFKIHLTDMSSNQNASSGGDKTWTTTGSGTNSQGNRWDSRDYGNSSAPNSNAYHYSNQNDSYYYSNPNGSTYYNNGHGGSTYTAPNGYSYTKGK